MNESEIRNRIKEIVRETLVEENEYQKFFQAVLAKHGGSIKKMGTQEKRDFFDKIDSAWKSRGEKRGTEKVEVFEATKPTNATKKFLKGMKKIKVKGLGGWMPGIDYVYHDEKTGNFWFVHTDGEQMKINNGGTLNQLRKVHGSEINEATDMGPYEKDNKEIIKFFVGNSKELDKYPKTLYQHTKYKDTKSLIRDLIKASHKPYTQIKVGMSDEDKRIMSFNYKKRSDMEKLLRSGNLGRIEIQIVDQARMGRAIDKFGTSA